MLILVGARMNAGQIMGCRQIDPLLVKQLAGELSADERNSLEAHLAACLSCFDEGQKLDKVWKQLEALPDSGIPPKLYEATYAMIRGSLQWEKSSFPWIVEIPQLGAAWATVVAILAGLVMAGISYFLAGEFVGRGVHYYVLYSLFGFWWLVFSVCAAFLLKRQTVKNLFLRSWRASRFWLHC